MNLFLYNIFLAAYQIGIAVVSVWNPKAGKWRTGRKNLLQRIATQLEMSHPRASTVWMHCASLGEFEQGRPLLDIIRKQFPGYRVIITFFSPSGYEIRRNYPGADYIFYLPMDSAANAREFIKLINPQLVLWIKYDFWHYYLAELKRRNIPTLLISGAFREGQRFFTSRNNFWKNMLQSFHYIFLQNSQSALLLNKIGLTDNVMVSGDTRFDRVIAIAAGAAELPLIKEFCGIQQVIVAGSTWEEDEAVFIHYVKANPSKKFILAPHEIDKDNLDDIKKEFPGSVFYSELPALQSQLNKPAVESNVLIIDCIGILAQIYAYAHVTYVGGGFGDDGLHNILEAAVYGKPVVFGPEIDKNFEALEMIESGGAVSIENALELELVLNEMLQNEFELNLKGQAAKKYVYENAGASLKVLQYIQENRLLTN